LKGKSVLSVIYYDFNTVTYSYLKLTVIFMERLKTKIKKKKV